MTARRVAGGAPAPRGDDRSGPKRFSREALGSTDWYRMLARVWGASFTAARVIEFAEEVAARLRADTFVVLHYPRGAAPRLLHGRIDHKHRAKSVNDYLGGNYALDPFYLRSEYCSREGLVCLRDVIEEDFGSSEYYKVHYRYAGLLDEICFCTDDGQGGHLNFSISRAVGKERFSRVELEAARVIAPLVNAALSSTWRDMAPDGSPADPHPDEIHHRYITHARMNFGRSVLTEREFEILQQLLQGKSVGLVARHLRIAASTVKVHRKHIYAKLEINSQAELFSLFLEVIAGARRDLESDPLDAYRRSRPGAT
ncbi:MAG TPA: helix-turn-helix transcriptional regulator [Steroidobacteraceae bacterium]|jgi:DNA-binding CsgD family transcriptional regulator|nr:helix-turn-helix transcriptional regulator [Steroidobacteraceae bacterium]